MSLTLMYFINLIFLTITSVFIIGTKGIVIKRTIANIPIVLFDDAIIHINNKEEISPHFDKDLVKSNVIYYLNLSLKNQCDKYAISFYPYKVVTIDGKKSYYFDASDNIQNIQMHFKCNYYQNFEVDTYLRVSITETGVIKDEL